MQDLNGRLCKLVSDLVEKGVPLSQARREFERQYIVAALRDQGGNLSRSAARLGIHRNTLRNKVSNLGIQGGDDSALSRPTRGRPRAG